MIQFSRNLTLFFVGFALLASHVVGAERQARMVLEFPSGERVDYLQYVPSSRDGEKQPLLLFLHGGGESGDDLERVTTHGPPRRIRDGYDYPMTVVSPLNPDRKGFWDEDRLARFLDALIEKLPIDEERVYLVGMSRGGYGAYRLAMENPERFAAMVVLCAAAPAPYADWLGNVPIWIIHGEKDRVIPVEESLRMEKKLREKGRNVRLTLHPEAGHDVWTETFQGDSVVEFLLQHRRSPTIQTLPEE